MKKILCGISVFLCLSCAVSGSTSETTRGHLILNGGGSKPDAVMEKFVELAGGPDALIVVFPTASELLDTGDYYRELFAGYGCTNVKIAEVRSKVQASNDEIAEMVAGAGGIFFAGGDQRRITETLIGTAAGGAVVEAFLQGAVVGGTSAGTACQSRLMITGDGDFAVLNAENVELWQGLGLFEGVIVDQHFVARQRQNRLISVVLEHPELLGVGIDEGTAVWVRPDGTFEVLGNGWVMIFDARSARLQRQTRGDDTVALGVHGMVTHVLLPGEVFDPLKNTIVGTTTCR